MIINGQQFNVVNEPDLGSKDSEHAQAAPEPSNGGGLAILQVSETQRVLDNPRLVIREYGGKTPIPKLKILMPH